MTQDTVNADDGWLGALMRDQAYREFIDVKKYRGKKLVIEGPVKLDLFLWCLSKEIIPVITTGGKDE